MNAKANRQLIEIPIETADGCWLARYSQLGLAGLNFPNRAGNRSALKPNPDVPHAVLGWHRLTAQALELVLAGGPPGELPPLDFSVGTDFQQRVWGEMRKISVGQTRSYGEIAQAIGNPEAVRAVGGACGANPIPVLVPCHRVLAANHKLGGFSSGLPWKIKLLAREGIEFADQ